MDREEILERSRKENENRLDERDREIQTKANSISQGVGMVLCVIMGFIGFVLTKTADFLWCSTVICWGMFAAERIVCAVRHRSVAHWVFAAILTLGFAACVVVYILCLVNVF